MQNTIKNKKTAICLLSNRYDDYIKYFLQDLITDLSENNNFDVFFLYDNNEDVEFNTNNLPENCKIFEFSSKNYIALGYNLDFQHANGQNLKPYENTTQLPLILLNKQYPEYEYMWLLEDDVYFNGNWNSFFSYFLNNPSDLLTSWLSDYQIYSEQRFWQPRIPEYTKLGILNSEKWNCFNVIFRLSKTAGECLERYWLNHFNSFNEFVIPTYLKIEGFEVQDINQDKEWYYYTKIGKPINAKSRDEDRIGTIRYIPIFNAEDMQSDILYHPYKVLPYKRPAISKETLSPSHLIKEFSYHFECISSDIVLCAIQKEEDDYLEEWLTYNFDKVGFDKIFIINDTRNDPYCRIAHIPYLRKKILEGKLCIVQNKFTNTSNRQNENYDMFYYSYKFRYVAYFDCDEFLTLPGYNNIHDFIDQFEKEYPDTYVISFPWVVYGDNGLLFQDNRPVQERFTTPAIIQSESTLRNDVIETKVMVKPGIENAHMYCHYMQNVYGKYGWYNSNGTQFIPYRKGQEWMTPITANLSQYPYLKHYRTKSLEEYFKKIKKGRATKKDGTFWKPDRIYFAHNPKTAKRLALFNDFFNLNIGFYYSEGMVTNDTKLFNSIDISLLKDKYLNIKENTSENS